MEKQVEQVHSPFTKVVIALVLASFIGLLGKPTFGQTDGKGGQRVESPLEPVKELIEAFNKHDPAGMAKVLDRQCKVYYMSKEGKAELSANSAKTVQAEMEQYFKKFPSAKSRIQKQMVAGRFVSIEEVVNWSSNGQPKTQSSLGVYEVVKGKIKAVWYYPAQK